MTPRRLTYAIASTALVISGAAFLAFAREGDAEATIEIDSSRTFQTIGGWEATIDLPDNEKGDPLLKARDRLFDKAVDDLGLNRVRLEIRSGAESRSRSWDRYQSGELTYKEWRPFRYTTENDNDDPNVIDWSGFDFSELDQMIEQQVEPLRGRLAARGETLFVNLCYVAFTKQIKGGAIFTTIRTNTPSSYWRRRSIFATNTDLSLTVGKSSLNPTSSRNGRRAVSAMRSSRPPNALRKTGSRRDLSRHR